MNSKRLYFVLLSAICVMVLSLVGGAYAVGQMLTTESSHLVDNRLQVAVLNQEQADLAKAKQDIKKYQDLANIAKSVVPQDKDQAQTVRQIVSLADSNGISLSSITFPSSTLGGAKASKPGLSQLTPVKGISGVYNLQLIVQTDVNHPVLYSKFISFLNALEHNRRTALVSGITIQPNNKNRSLLAFTLVLDEYIKP